MGFEISEQREFWCIVAHPTDDDVMILHTSLDVDECDALPGGSWAADNSLSCDWTENRPHGVYRLTLSVTYSDDKDPDDRYVERVDVTAVELLYEFPAKD